MMLRPTTRVCHARQAVPLLALEQEARAARFEKDPKRWCATPRFVTDLHRALTEKLARLAADPRIAPAFFPGDGTRPGTCLVGSGVAFAHAWDVLDELGYRDQAMAAAIRPLDDTLRAMIVTMVLPSTL